ncbi:MAG: heptaprenyl diphosphate synthase, partial [Oscillospiraceae bacterium]|nr:heptaprenyl diphosphate synthase [Oscillospiraceae bacterium]
MRAKKTAFLGILGALALVLGFLEQLIVPDIPFLPVGAKPGLSNIVTMYTACTLGFPGALY